MNLRLLLPLLLFATGLWAGEAPTPAVTTTNALNTLKSEIQITSRSSEVNLRSNVVVYVGNVRVTEATMSMTCEYLVAIMPQRGGRIESILAQTNVVIDMTDERGDKVHGTGEKLLYTYQVTESATNEVVQLSGNPLITTSQGSTRADVITYNRTTQNVRFENPQMVIEHDGSLTNLLPGTQSNLRTNPPPR
jgi:lipopolysaccharide transport protein LptA